MQFVPSVYLFVRVFARWQDRLRQVRTKPADGFLVATHISRNTCQLFLAFIFFVGNRKIDPSDMTGRPRLVKSMTEQLDKMQHQYDALANQMSEATVQPEAMDKPFVYTYACMDHWCGILSNMKTYARCLLHNAPCSIHGYLSQVISRCSPAELCELHEAGCWHEQLGPACKVSWSYINPLYMHICIYTYIRKIYSILYR